MMTYTGHVENGLIVLENGTPLPEGTKVRVEVCIPPETEPEPASPADERVEGGETLHDALKEFIGVVDDMPSDLARNHDHYIHGAPKK